MHKAGGAWDEAKVITTVQCSICSQLNNKPRVVVTDFRLHHFMVSLSDGYLKQLNFRIQPRYIYKYACARTCPLNSCSHALVMYIHIYLYCGYVHEGGKQMYRNF